MPSIFEPSTRTTLAGRLAKLRPDTRREWGKMSAAEMQVHITDGLRIALGTKHCAPKSTALRLAPVRWLIIHSPLPWPKGAPTAPELLNPKTATWEADRAQLIEAIDAVAARGSASDYSAHPAFGKLNAHSWGVLMWRHIDHHLRQFGL